MFYLFRQGGLCVGSPINDHPWSWWRFSTLLHALWQSWWAPKIRQLDYMKHIFTSRLLQNHITHCPWWKCLQILPPMVQPKALKITTQMGIWFGWMLTLQGKSSVWLLGSGIVCWYWCFLFGTWMAKPGPGHRFSQHHFFQSFTGSVSFFSVASHH